MIHHIPARFAIALLFLCFSLLHSSSTLVLAASTASDSSSCNVSLALGLQIIPPSSTTSETTSCPCGSDTCDSSELCYVFPQARRNDGISKLESLGRIECMLQSFMC